MTLPSSAISKGRRWVDKGQGERVTSKNTTDKPPASAARAKVINQAERCGSAVVPVASRVMGSVTANIATPSTPSHMPRVSCLVFMPQL